MTEKNAKGPLSFRSRPGHIYQGINVSGDAQVHFGDYAGNVYRNFLSQTGAQFDKTYLDHVDSDWVVVPDDLRLVSRVHPAEIHQSQTLPERTEFISRTKLLDWLRGPVGSENKRQTVPPSSPGTCDWLLRSQTFRSWRRSSILWLHGPAGSGKTTLFTHVLKHFESIADTTHVAGYYCDFDAGEKSSFEALLRTITYQLAKKSSHLPKSISRYYVTQSGRGQREASTSTISDILNDLIADLDDCVLMVDALDEMRSEEDQQKTLGFLSNLAHQSGSKVHLFFSSLSTESLNHTLGSLADFKVDLTEYGNNLDDDIKQMVKKSLTQLRGQFDHDTLSQWAFAVNGHADKSFLWARILLSEIVNGVQRGDSAADISDTLLRIPTEIDAFYEQMLLRIPARHKRLALVIIQCLICAPRPLKFAELQKLVQLRQSDIGQTIRFDSDKVGPICGGFVTSTRYGPIIGERVFLLVHTSVSSFFADHVELDADTGISMTALDSHIALSFCLIEHMLDVVEARQRSQSQLDLSESDLIMPYIQEHWLYHISAVESLGSIPTELAQMIAHLLSTQKMRQELIALQNPDWLATSITNSAVLKQLTDGSTLYYAARLGLGSLCQFLFEKASLNERGGRYGTPFHAAVVAGHTSVVKLFLTQLDGNLVTDKSDNLRFLSTIIEPRFAYAQDLFQEASRETLRQILENDVESGRYGTPLQLAAYSGHLDLVILILDACGGIPDLGSLHAAAYQGHVEVFELLFNASTEEVQHARDTRQRSALHKAALNGQLDMMKKLVDLHFDTEDLDDSRSTPLDLAAERHHFDCFDWLLSEGKWHGENKQFISKSIEVAIGNRNEFDISGYSEDSQFGLKKGSQALVRKFNCKSDSLTPRKPAAIIQKHYDFSSLKDNAKERLLVCLWREQSILRQMSHPNIVKFHGFNFDYGTDEADLYMEAWGEDMSRALPSTKPLESIPVDKRPVVLSILDMWSLVVDLAAALAYCHHGIYRTHDTYVAKAPWEAVLHRDIKPTNLLRSQDSSGLWVTKLCDLGFAKIMTEMKSTLSRGMGTDDYLAPEVSDEKEHPSIKSDIFGLGATVLDLNLFRSRRARDLMSTEVLKSLMERCKLSKAQERPSSLEILQVAIREKQKLLSVDPDYSPLILQHALLPDYFLQAFVEILNRLFRAYRVLPDAQRDIWCKSLTRLKTDADQSKWSSWAMNDSLILTMILGEWERVPDLIAKRTTPNCESWWNSRDIKPVEVAEKEEKEELVALLAEKQQ